MMFAKIALTILSLFGLLSQTTTPIKPILATKHVVENRATTTPNTASTKLKVEKVSVRKEAGALRGLRAPASILPIPATTPSPTPIKPLPAPSFTEINTHTRDALVNIICTSESAGYFEPLSGSGIIIDPRGIVLTAGHVGQYFLLNKYHDKPLLDCFLRSGNPATPAYTAELLYLSPVWVKDNITKLTNENPTSNGENDFALLVITGSKHQGEQVPVSLPFLPITLDENTVDVGTNVLLAGYPAGFLGGIAIQKDLYQVSTVTQIKKIFTFSTTTLDEVSLGGSLIAQHGASGGPVVTATNNVLGVIVTSTAAVDTDGRDLRAITLAHINRRLVEDTSISLPRLLTSDITTFKLQFQNDILPSLIRAVTDELDKKNPNTKQK